MIVRPSFCVWQTRPRVSLRRPQPCGWRWMGWQIRCLASKAEADLRQAVDLLLDASRLPLSKEDSKALRARAGQIAIDADKAVARDVYRRIVDDEPDNREAMAVLARLYEQAEQFSELLTLRRRQLDLLSDGEARLALRLEIARVGEVVEGRTGRFEALLANLEELPGHPATLAALSTLLRARGRYGELADIFSAQARKLEGMGDNVRAARLWTEVAALAESPLGDSARAIAAWERVVAAGQQLGCARQPGPPVHRLGRATAGGAMA